MSDAIVDAVRSKYGAVAESGLSTAHDGVRAVAEAFGYSADELASIPAEANMGLSCGNPTAFASLRPGEVVVDLGCGGGLDVFLAAKKVGPDGQGDRHRHDARDARPRPAERGPIGRHERRVSSGDDRQAAARRRVGRLRDQQLRDQSGARQAGRVPRDRAGAQAGRAAGGERHRAQAAAAAGDRRDLMAYVGCIAGAISLDEYRSGLAAAGFEAVEIIDSGSDLNAYAKVENQSGCCSPAMSEGGLPVVSDCCSPHRFARRAGGAAASATTSTTMRRA